MRILRTLACLLWILPASRLKNRLLSLVPGWSVAPSASVSPIFVRNVPKIVLASGTRVGLGCVFLNLTKVKLDEASSIGRINWIYASRHLVSQVARDGGWLQLGPQSGITWRHHIDCSGGVSIGKLATVGGQGTVVLTHAIDFMASEQRCLPVRIGDACFVATSSVIGPGVSIGDRIVVGAGSVVVRDLTETDSLYAGAPAAWRKSLSGAKYFERRTGFLRDEPLD